MRWKIGFGIIVLLLTTSASSVGSRISPESSAVYHLGMGMRFYALEHDGRWPESWEELGQYMDLNVINRDLECRGVSPIQDRYEFINGKLLYQPSHAPTNGWPVLLMRTVPIAERSWWPFRATGRKRYFIYRMEDGQTEFGAVSEAEAQAMLRQANLTFTPKAHLRAVEYEGYVFGRDPNWGKWQQLGVLLLAVLSTIGGVAWVIHCLIRRRRVCAATDR